MTTDKIAYSFSAKLSLFPTENGGRKKPVFNHYRPSFIFNTRQHFSGEITIDGQTELFPGDTASVFVRLLPSRLIRHNLKSGDVFSISEGDKIIGVGVIENIEKGDIISKAS